MSQGGGSGQADSTFGMVLMFAVIGFAVYMLYRHNKEAVHHVIMAIRMGELHAASLFTNYYDPLINDLKRVKPGDMQWKDIIVVSRYTGKFMAPITMAILSGLSVYILFKHPNSLYKRKLNLIFLMKYQAREWAAIAPVVKADPLNDKTGQWLEALNPHEWVQRHGIELIEKAPNRDAARSAFARQLRRPWNGLKDAPIHVKALIVAFALRGGKKGDECYDLLGKLSRGWANHGSVAKAVAKDGELAKIIRKYSSDPAIMAPALDVARRHAWTETALAAVLTWARGQGGVLASADFIWLRAEDRGLWYVMNSVGRHTSHVEAAGAMAHWKAEQVTKRPMPEPDVDEAVFGLEEYFGQMGAE